MEFRLEEIERRHWPRGSRTRAAGPRLMRTGRRVGHARQAGQSLLPARSRSSRSASCTRCGRSSSSRTSSARRSGFAIAWWEPRSWPAGAPTAPWALSRRDAGEPIHGPEPQDCTASRCRVARRSIGDRSAPGRRFRPVPAVPLDHPSARRRRHDGRRGSGRAGPDAGSCRHETPRSPASSPRPSRMSRSRRLRRSLATDDARRARRRRHRQTSSSSV